MNNNQSNLRKAAILFRSLDADTAAVMLAHLSAEEAAEIRRASRELGPVEAADQEEVLAELQRKHSARDQSPSAGVELCLSAVSPAEPSFAESRPSTGNKSKRFDFLDDAPVEVLVPRLIREHVQTIAVVLSHLEPARAATVLAALPEKLQAKTLERLSQLRESDPESVVMLESELASWVAQRSAARSAAGRRTSVISQIMAAADPSARAGILRNVKAQNARLAQCLDGGEPPQLPPRKPAPCTREASFNRQAQLNHAAHGIHRSTIVGDNAKSVDGLQRSHEAARLPHISFDDLVNLDARALADVLREMDSNVLTLALAGSSDLLVDRICSQFPKQAARNFRRRLRQLGPTRLSDVETAQRAVASFASRYLAKRRSHGDAPTS